MSSLLLRTGGLLRGALSSYVRVAVKYHLAFVLLALMLGGLSAWLAQGVGIDSRLQALLPAQTASASAQAELKARLRSSSPLYFVIQAGELSRSRAVARRLYDEVLKWPETRWAMYKRDPQYFLDNRLLYVSAPDLDELEMQIDERYRWEECKRLPGCQNLDPDEPPLPSEADLQALFDKDPDVRALAGLFGGDTARLSTTRPGAQKAAARQAGDKTGAEASTGGEAELGELCSAETRVCTVHIAIDGDSGDLSYATSILKRSEALFAEVAAAHDDPALRIAVSGPYRDAPKAREAVGADLKKTTSVTILLVLLVVFLQFKGVRSVLLLLLPAAMGVLWTLAPLGLLGVQLNLISVFTLAVLAGVGIDFGVHLLTHYAERRGEGLDVATSLDRTLQELSPSLAVAGVTTASGFAALAAASFRGFAEMGPIAAAGVIASLIAFLLVFPPLAALLDRGARCPFVLRDLGMGALRRIPAIARPVAVLGVLIALGFGAIGAGFGHDGVGFEYNFRNLRTKGSGHGIPWTSTLHGTARTAVYLLADDHSALQAFATAVRAAPPADVVDPDKPFLIAPGAFIPAGQPERLAAIGKLKGTLTAARAHADDELTRSIDNFMPLVGVKQAVSLERMPRWVQDWLVERDGRFGTLGILYVNLSGSNAHDMEHLAARIDAWRAEFPAVQFASPNAQLGEVTPRLRNEAPTILGLALLGVALGTLVVGRSLRRSLIVFIPLMLTMGVSVGLMALFDIRINLYNMLVFPLAFGIGVDGAVYVTWALGEADADTRVPLAARAVLGSTLTTVAGFGSLMVSNNPGLASIGLLATLTLLVSLLANLLWLPAAWSATVGGGPPSGSATVGGRPPSGSATVGGGPPSGSATVGGAAPAASE